MKVVNLAEDDSCGPYEMAMFGGMSGMLGCSGERRRRALHLLLSFIIL